MKLLVIADDADAGLWDHFSKDKLAGVDAILSCGDLPADYLRSEERRVGKEVCLYV